jgi:hypothetical protein
MAETTAEVALANELASLRATVDRLERHASWHTVGFLLAIAVAGGALALPFLVPRLEMRELVVQELRVVDDARKTRARLAWREESNEVELVVFDAANRRRVELATADEATVLELLPTKQTASMRMQVGEEDVMLTLRNEPEGGVSSRLDVGVHRDLVVQNAVAGVSTLASSVASGRVALHLARSTEGLHSADIELDPHGPTLELRTEQAGRARLHVPPTQVAPEILVEAFDGAIARLTPAKPAAVTPPGTPPATPPGTPKPP